MDSKEYEYNRRLGEAKDQSKFIADYANSHNDNISRNIISDIPSHNVLDHIKWDNMFGYITPSEFITKYHDMFSKNEISNLKNLESQLREASYGKHQIDHIKSVIGGMLLGKITNNVKYMSSYIIENSIRDIEDKGVKLNSWYHLYHIDIGSLDRTNIDKFQKLMDNYLFNRDFLEFKFNIYTTDELKCIMDRLLPYSSEELNLLYLDNIEPSITNLELITDIYTIYVFNMVQVDNMKLHQELKSGDLIYHLYKKGLKRYGF